MLKETQLTVTMIVFRADSREHSTDITIPGLGVALQNAQLIEFQSGSLNVAFLESNR